MKIIDVANDNDTEDEDLTKITKIKPYITEYLNSIPKCSEHPTENCVLTLKRNYHNFIRDVNEKYVRLVSAETGNEDEITWDTFERNWKQLVGKIPLDGDRHAIVEAIIVRARQRLFEIGKNENI